MTSSWVDSLTGQDGLLLKYKIQSAVKIIKPTPCACNLIAYACDGTLTSVRAK